METNRISAGGRFPAMGWDAIDGQRICPANAAGWRALVVYRGRHCPLCRSYLNTLNDMLDDFREAGVAVSAVSADTLGKAKAEAAECGWRFPVGHDLSVPQMRQLGLYVSDPGSSEETDRPYAEPALFVINPDGLVQVVCVSNAPFARPELKAVLKGLQAAIRKHSPIHGRA